MLDRNRAYKPLDFGNGLVAGSINDQGRMIALNTYQPAYGYVTLTNMPPFPDGRWYDPAFVRQYRAEMASPDLLGFGLNFGEQSNYPWVCAIELPAMPSVRLELAAKINAEILTFSPLDHNKRAIAGAIQLCTIRNEQTEVYPLSYCWQGQLALTRASYAQLTEGGPLPRPPDVYQVNEAEAVLTIENTALGQAVAIMVAQVMANSDQLQPMHGWQVTEQPEGKQLSLKLPGTIVLEAGQTARLIAVYGWGDNSAEARRQIAVLRDTALKEQTAQYWQALADLTQIEVDDPPGRNWLIRQNLAYILACCAVPLEDGSVCLITDHQLLPLAWTRDAYYAVQALLALLKQTKAASVEAFSAGLTQLLRQHLIWLFEVAERPAGYWGRAYLTNGRCKDFIFQLDQQCYPLLELADYVEATGDRELAQRLKPYLEKVLAGLLTRRAKEAWLFPTSETPADDKVELPYHFSSQLTLWRTLKRLAELDILDRYRPAQLHEIAVQIRQAIYTHMVAENQGQNIFCYLTDLVGNYRFYHDANDWPTVLAVSWEFCRLDDPIWQATLAYGFSPANQDGYYPGEFGGLGSIHTPHTWPLGDFQELLLAYLQQDTARLSRCWSKIMKVACWDGAFPEAYDEQTGAVASRHWFAWPGAMLVAMHYIWLNNLPRPT